MAILNMWCVKTWIDKQMELGSEDFSGKSPWSKSETDRTWGAGELSLILSTKRVGVVTSYRGKNNNSLIKVVIQYYLLIINNILLNILLIFIY